MNAGDAQNATRGIAAGPSAMRGYTLIEVIVAFAVLGLALTLLLGTLSGAARQVREADDGGRAAMYAQSLLAQQGLGTPLLPGEREGDFEDGHFHWTLAVAPYVDPALPPPTLVDPGAPKLLQLSFSVQWGQGDRARKLSLQSLRLVSPTLQGGQAAP